MRFVMQGENLRAGQSGKTRRLGGSASQGMQDVTAHVGVRLTVHPPTGGVPVPAAVSVYFGVCMTAFLQSCVTLETSASNVTNQRGRAFIAVPC